MAEDMAKRVAEDSLDGMAEGTAKGRDSG